MIAVLGGSGKKSLPEIAPESRYFDLKFERFLNHTFQILVFDSNKTSIFTD